MREEFMLATRRDSRELERELVDRRIDDAFGKVYDYLEPAAAYLRQVCDGEARRALEQLERAYLQALEVAARSGLGCRSASNADFVPVQAVRAPRDIPLAAQPVEALPNADLVLDVRVCGQG